MKVLLRRTLVTALLLFVSLAWVSNASAQHFWAGAVFGSTTDEWVAAGTTNQWGDAAFAQLSPPGVADFVVVLNDVAGSSSLLPYPHIRTDVGTVSLMTIAPNNGDVAELTIENGGSLTVLNATNLSENQGGGTGSSAILSIIGGSLTTGSLVLGTNGGSQAQIDLDAGFLLSGAVSFAGNANIDLELGAVFLLDGDQTGAVPGWTTDGSLTAEDGAGTVESRFDSGLGRTIITVLGAIPSDFNNDGSVDGLDLTQWQGDYGVDAGSDADFDLDTDGADFLIWQKTTNGPSAIAAVPEPTTSMLLLGACCLFAGLKSRRN